MLYALCCYSEEEKMILRLSTNIEDCETLKNEIRENFNNNNLRFFEKNYWVEKIDISKNGVVWENQ